MICPACKGELSERQFGDIALDICAQGCGGIWFDHQELKKFDEPHEFPNNPDLNISPKLRSTINTGAVRECPKCPGETLARVWTDPNRQIEIDQCFKCSGIWLDTGELSILRSQFKTFEERQKASDAALNPALNSAIQALQDDALEQLETAKLLRSKSSYVSLRSGLLKLFS